MAEDRLAIVTGGGRNIGRAIVFSLLKQGRRVAALDINDETLGELKELVKKEGFDVLTEKIDITDSPLLNETIERLAEDNNGVGILVNNAGITRDNLIIRMTDEDFDLVIKINLKAAFVASRAVIRSMMRNRFGRIISISSTSGVIGNAGQTNYSASKAALIGMSKTLAREYGKKNITVNCVAPGFITTNMSDKVPEKLREMAKMSIPLNRFGDIDDVANAVGFLASDESGYITGQVLCVDGGLAM